MKIGIDGVLLGAWFEAPHPQSRILDVGCGCGLISFMAAQRYADAYILGIDIHEASVQEAIENRNAFPHHPERINFKVCDFSTLQTAPWKMIVSNPPYFDAGIEKPVTPREISRHAAALGPEVLIRHARSLLTEDGVLAMITPADTEERLQLFAAEVDMYARRITRVIPVEHHPPKRILTEWTPAPCDTIRDTMLIERLQPDGTRRFSNEYIRLCAPFYLNM